MKYLTFLLIFLSVFSYGQRLPHKITKRQINADIFKYKVQNNKAKNILCVSAPISAVGGLFIGIGYYAQNKAVDKRLPKNSTGDVNVGLPAAKTLTNIGYALFIPSIGMDIGSIITIINAKVKIKKLQKLKLQL